ncbi:MAG: (Fe-S)-binding protein [Desulfobacterales bacterium]|nr:(Fe-S)-binding protein [Desulfobacterales bacterium]
MHDIKELTLLMKELENQLSICMRCGMCQAVCPVFAETGREADVARGKLALLEGLAHEMFKDPKGVYKRLTRCLLCGSCAETCPSRVSILEIFIKARVIITSFMGLSSAQKLILRGVLASPATFNRFLKWSIWVQKLFNKPADKFLGTSCARFASPLLRNRHFIPLAGKPFHRLLPAQRAESSRSGIKVGFFVGCLTDKIFPGVAKAVCDVLDHHGVGLFIPKAQGCCGIPALTSGDTDSFESLVNLNLDMFDEQGFDYLITACATCAYTIKKLWPMMFRKESSDFKDRVEKMADKTMDINQFLVSKVGIKTGEIKDDQPVIVTYHDPCHLSKSLGVSAEPRTLIKANPRYCLREMPEADRCCGSGGSFNLQHYALSFQIGKRKLTNILSTGCSMVATGCPACMIQLSDMLSRSQSKIVVKHPVEIYAEGLNFTP